MPSSTAIAIFSNHRHFSSSFILSLNFLLPYLTHFITYLVNHYISWKLWLVIVQYSVAYGLGMFLKFIAKNNVLTVAWGINRNISLFHQHLKNILNTPAHNHYTVVLGNISQYIVMELVRFGINLSFPVEILLL